MFGERNCSRHCPRGMRGACVSREHKTFLSHSISQKKESIARPRHRNLVLLPLRPLCRHLALSVRREQGSRYFTRDRFGEFFPTTAAVMRNIRYPGRRCALKKFARAHPFHHRKRVISRDVAHNEKRREELTCTTRSPCSTDVSLLFLLGPLFFYSDITASALHVAKKRKSYRLYFE